MDKFIVSSGNTNFLQTDMVSNPSSSITQTNHDPSPQTVSTDSTPQPELKSPKKEPKDNPVSLKKKPSRESTVWDHFTKIEGGDPKNRRCKCNYCDKDYACDPKKVGTSSLWGHLNNQCKKNPNRIDEKKQKLLSFEGNNNLVPYTFSKSDCRKALAKMVVFDELSFRFVEGEGFKKFVQTLQPKFVPSSRVTVSRDIFQLYLDERSKLRKELVTEGRRICLTTDCWTSIQQVNYLCLTAHYVDAEWSLQKRILNFVQISNHKGETIGKLIESCLSGWGIERILTITVDNATTNDVAVAFLKKRVCGWKSGVLEGEHMHMRCCAHIVNLIVSDGLKELNESISAIRTAVRYIRSSPARMQKFKACAQQVKIEYKGSLVLDVPTRWNSTYLMLNVAVKFQQAFDRFEEEDDKYLAFFHEEEGGKKKVGPPSSIDWENANVFVKFLQTFYDVTLKFSATLSCTSNLYYHEICEIQLQLCEMVCNGDPLLSKMAVGMKKKFDKYWGTVNGVNQLLFIAAILDPRYKMSYLNYCFSCLYDVQTAATISHKVKKTLGDLYVFYNVGKSPISSLGSESGIETPNVNLPPTSAPKRKLMSSFAKLLEERSLVDKSNDLDRYLVDDNVDPLTENFDILSWWKDNSFKYPGVAKIARDMLAIPVSTVASESAFSTGGRILDSFRSSLSPRMVEALVCSQNWLRSTHDGLQQPPWVDEIDIYSEFEVSSSDEGCGGIKSSGKSPSLIMNID